MMVGGPSRRRKDDGPLCPFAGPHADSSGRGSGRLRQLQQMQTHASLTRPGWLVDFARFVSLRFAHQPDERGTTCWLGACRTSRPGFRRCPLLRMKAAPLATRPGLIAPASGSGKPGSHDAPPADRFGAARGPRLSGVSRGRGSPPVGVRRQPEHAGIRPADARQESQGPGKQPPPFARWSSASRRGQAAPWSRSSATGTTARERSRFPSGATMPSSRAVVTAASPRRSSRAGYGTPSRSRSRGGSSSGSSFRSWAGRGAAAATSTPAGHGGAAVAPAAGPS